MKNKSKRKKYIIITTIILLIVIAIITSIVILIQNRRIEEYGTDDNIKKFNSNYSKYEGKKIGSVIKAMILEAQVSNSNDESSKTNRHITVILNGKEIESTSEIESLETYEVKVPSDGYDENGYIKKIVLNKEVINVEKNKKKQNR